MRKPAGKGRVEQTRDGWLEMGAHEGRRGAGGRRRPQRPFPAESAEIEAGRTLVVVIGSGTDGGRGMKTAGGEVVVVAALSRVFGGQTQRFRLRRGVGAGRAAAMKSQVFGGGAQQAAERHLLRQRDRRERAGTAGVGSVRGGSGDEKLLGFALFSLQPVVHIFVGLWRAVVAAGAPGGRRIAAARSIFQKTRRRFFYGVVGGVDGTFTGAHFHLVLAIFQVLQDETLLFRQFVQITFVLVLVFTSAGWVRGKGVMEEGGRVVEGKRIKRNQTQFYGSLRTINEE